MVKRKTRRKTMKRKVVSSPGKVGLMLLGIGLFYFFIIFQAKESPLIFVNQLTAFFFGLSGNYFFFGMLILLGLMLILYPQNRKERFFLYSFISFVFLLAILSFPVLEHSDNDSIIANGGYIGYGIINIFAFLMGNNILTTQIFAIIIFGLSFLFLFWKLNLFLLIPKIEFEIPEKEKNRKTLTITKPNIFKKAGDSSTKTEVKNNTQNEKTDKNILKNILKSKFEKKIIEKKQEQITISYPKDKPTFSVENLEKGDPNYDIDENILIQQANDIQAKLKEFNIPVEIAGYEVGPTVIQFQIKPDRGIKVSSIENMKKDLSLSLKSSIRILAPIPGTEYVGIEMPNPKSKIVHLGEILSSPEFSNSMSKNLTNLAIGKAINGEIFLHALEKMPHLLVAGQTGSGKSVAINDFIISLLYQNTPDELKFVMIDPKQVELGLYEGLPYLMAPVINEPDKALKALKYLVDLMNSRYKALKNLKVKTRAEYNKKVDEKQKMSRIVIVVDELADLMMSGNKKEVEHNISRLAQMARAVGIHLILATQRPSVNVVTGLIKANIPTRIAFGVVTQIDSRTILDRSGAEDLLGKGDSLFVSPNYKHPIRVQAPFIDTDDTEEIVASLKQKYLSGLDDLNSIYNQELISILNGTKPESSYLSDGSSDDDELIEQAMQIIQETGKASITLLQRRLKVGFARAARLMDQLEERGVVGPQEGSKPRDILI